MTRLIAPPRSTSTLWATQVALFFLTGCSQVLQRHYESPGIRPDCDSRKSARDFSTGASTNTSVAQVSNLISYRNLPAPGARVP